MAVLLYTWYVAIETTNKIFVSWKQCLCLVFIINKINDLFSFMDHELLSHYLTLFFTENSSILFCIVDIYMGTEIYISL